MTVIPIAIGTGLVHILGGHGNKRVNEGHPNYIIVENGQNTENSLVDMKRHAVTRKSVKDPQPGLV